MFADHVKLKESQSSLTLMEENIIVQVVNMQSSIAGYGFVIDNLNWGNKNLTNSTWFNVNVKTSDIAQNDVSSLQAALYFPKEALTEATVG